MLWLYVLAALALRRACAWHTDPHHLLSSNVSFMNAIRLALNLDLSESLSESTKHDLYRTAAEAAFRSITPPLASALWMFEQTRAHDVFFWLALHGNGSLAKQLWPLCDLPIHIALLGSSICRKVEDESKHIESLGGIMEGWAYSAIHMSPSEKRSRQVNRGVCGS